MMIEAVWFLMVGGLLVLMATSRRLIAKLPLSGAMVYLAVGMAIGPAGANLINPELGGGVTILRTIAEIGLVISLFAIGMFLRVPLTNRLWRLPLRLAGPGMVLTIGLMFAAVHWGLGLEIGPALMLAAATAPTDPVLANELRVTEAGDDEPLRFTLSAEGGLNDGAAYPFALGALALCGVSGLAVPLSWSFVGGIIWGTLSALSIGWLFGTGVVVAVTRLRTKYEVALGLEGFFALGLMALSYGAALLVHGYAFVAVFAAGVSLRRQELKATGEKAPAQALESVEQGDREEAEKSPELAHAYMAESMMAFSVEIERLVEFVLMILIGSVISAHWRELLHWSVVWPSIFLLLFARPIGAMISLMGSPMTRQQRMLAGWLGIRGVGAFYYLLFGLERARDALQPIIPIVLSTIVLSVVLHGASATGLLGRYLKHDGERS